jgi:hypothetical protein
MVRGRDDEEILGPRFHGEAVCRRIGAGLPPRAELPWRCPTASHTRVVLFLSRAHRQATRTSRALSRPVACLFVAVALLFGTVQAGAHYFYCEAFGLLAFDPCASASHEASPCPLQSLQSQPVDCCQRITVPAMPDGAGANEPSVAPAAFVAVVPAAQYAISQLGVFEVPRAFQRGRWRRPPRSAGDLRAELMVFLT